MEQVGFDPSAELRIDGVPQHVEAMIVREDDGRIALTCEDEDGAWIVRLTLRSDFLDAVIAQARAREQDAA